MLRRTEKSCLRALQFKSAALACKRLYPSTGNSGKAFAFVGNEYHLEVGSAAYARDNSM
jgi:hypothetical protein